MRSRRSVLKTAGSLGLVGTTGLSGCLGGGGGDGGDGGDSGDGGDGTDTPTTTGDDGEKEEITVGYVYNEPVGKIGWTHTHEVAREALEEEFDWYNTQVVEDISTSEAKDTFTSLAEDGVDAIEAATFGYGAPAAEVVQQYDDLYIETPRLAPVEGYSGPKLGYYLGRLEDACYVAGKAAGMVTESNTLGYVMSFGIPSTITELNALFLGAREVNPDVEMIVRTVETWYDPPVERDAASALVDEGADVIGYRTSTPAALQVAKENDLWGYGYADLFQGTDVVWDKYITSRAWNWTPFYRQTAEWTRKGQPGAQERFNLDQLRGNYFGLENGGVQLDEPGSAVPDDVVTEMDDTISAFKSGELTSDDVFQGSKYADWSDYKRVSQASEYLDGIQA